MNTKEMMAYFEQQMEKNKLAKDNPDSLAKWNQVFQEKPSDKDVKPHFEQVQELDKKQQHSYPGRWTGWTRSELAKAKPSAPEPTKEPVFTFETHEAKKGDAIPFNTPTEWTQLKDKMDKERVEQQDWEIFPILKKNLEASFGKGHSKKQYRHFMVEHLLHYGQRHYDREYSAIGELTASFKEFFMDLDECENLHNYVGFMMILSDMVCQRNDSEMEVAMQHAIVDLIQINEPWPRTVFGKIMRERRWHLVRDRVLNSFWIRATKDYNEKEYF